MVVDGIYWDGMVISGKRGHKMTKLIKSGTFVVGRFGHGLDKGVVRHVLLPDGRIAHVLSGRVYRKATKKAGARLSAAFRRLEDTAA